MFFPHHTIARRILVNATLIWLGWLGLRFVAALAGWGVSASPLLSGYIVLLTAALAVFDARRRGRLLLLESLGISWRPVLVLAVLPPAIFEFCWLLAAQI